MMPVERQDSGDDASSSDENMPHRALPVGPLPHNFDPSKPPTTAEEYLQQVMWEAKQCPDVVTVKLDQKRVKAQPALIRPNVKEAAPRSYLPDAATQKSIIDKFLQSRNQLEEMKRRKDRPKPPVNFPKSNTPEHWCRFCFGDAFQRNVLQKLQEAKAKNRQTEATSGFIAVNPSSDSSDSEGDSENTVSETVIPVEEVCREGGVSTDSMEIAASEQTEGQKPLLSILLNISHTTMQRLMEWHVSWLQVAGFSEQQGKWLYSLLHCLEKPLTPELCDNVRQMVFCCARARAKLPDATHVDLAQLNLLITIASRYFGQEDLADPR